MKLNLNPLDFLFFYRILNWKHKVSSIRPMGYTFFGYLMAAKFEIAPLAANTIAVLGALLFWFSINDFAALKTGEENFMAAQIKQNKLTRQKALLLCLLPLIFCSYVIFTGSRTAIFIFFFSLVFNLLYSTGPTALKNLRYFGIVAAIIAAPLLFLEAETVLGKFTLQMFFMAIIVALFHLYMELLHIIEDFQAGEEVGKIKSQASAVKILKITPLATLTVSLVFALFYPIFLITAFFSAVRILSLKGFKQEQIQKTRRDLLSPRLSLYEFALYALFALILRSG